MARIIKLLNDKIVTGASIIEDHKGVLSMVDDLIVAWGSKGIHITRLLIHIVNM